jgi:hypothetical protein
MKNKLIDLNNHLFAQLERLNDEDLAGDQLKAEADRGKAVAMIAREIIGNGRLVLDAHKVALEYDSRTEKPVALMELLGNDK